MLRLPESGTQSGSKPSILYANRLRSGAAKSRAANSRPSTLSRKPRRSWLHLVGRPVHRAVSHRDAGEDDRRRLRHLAEPVGAEQVEAVDAAEGQLPARALVPGAEVELGGLQAVAHAVVRDFARARVETREAVVRAEPQPSLAVAAHAVDHVAGQAVARGEGLEGAVRRRGGSARCACPPTACPRRPRTACGRCRRAGSSGRRRGA